MRKIKSRIVVFMFTMALTMGTFSAGATPTVQAAGQQISVAKTPTKKPSVKIKNVKVTTIEKTVKKTYGTDYLAKYTYDKTEIKEKFGLSSSLYSEVIAKGPQMSVHVDTFIAVKAKKGKKASVEKALKKYRQSLIDSTLQYPMNIPKIQASRVDVVGDYVFFIMLGTIKDDEREQSEAKQIKAYKAQNKKGYDAIYKLLTK